jgi:hypothetical protein
MTATLLTLILAAFISADTPTGKETPRKPHPFAPSLPKLTDAEEEKLDEIIDRFIQYDLGKLQGAEGRKALADFQALGPEATFALIRGLNRAANIEGSCPAVVIAKKLGRILGTTDDTQLLDFARENIGLGVTQSRHMGLLKDLRASCLLRKAAVARKPGGSVGGSSEEKSLRSMSVAALAQAASNERGPRLKAVLMELEQRQGDEVIAALGTAATSYEAEIQQLARDLLLRHLSRQTNTVLKDKLKDDRAEVRAAAASIVGSKGLRLGSELIDLLADENARVRDAAHLALVRLNRGVDFGPKASASETEREAAIKKWREWWAKQK